MYIMVRDLRSMTITIMFIFKSIINKKTLYHFEIKNIKGGRPERFIEMIIIRILRDILDFNIILNIIFLTVINSIITFNEMEYKVRYIAHNDGIVEITTIIHPD